MTKQQILIYRFIFYDFLKSALENTPLFLRWYEKLSNDQVGLLHQCYLELQTTVPCWVYITYIDLMRKNTRDQVFEFIGKRDMLNIALVAIIFKLYNMLEDWREYRIDAYEKQYETRFEEIPFVPKGDLPIPRVYRQAEGIHMPTVKRHIDLVSLDVEHDDLSAKHSIKP